MERQKCESCRNSFGLPRTRFRLKASKDSTCHYSPSYLDILKEVPLYSKTGRSAPVQQDREKGNSVNR